MKDAPKGERITFDSSVLISYIGSKDGNTLAEKVIKVAKMNDIPIVTNIMLDECIMVAERKKTRRGQITASREEVVLKLKEINNIIHIPIISDEELKKRYGNRDITDLKILYSADKTRCVFLIAYDGDLIDGKNEGLEIEVLHPTDYLKKRADHNVKKQE